MTTINEQLLKNLESSGFKGAIVSFKQLDKVQSYYSKVLEFASTNYEVFDNLAAVYGLRNLIKPVENYPEGKSFIITAAPQPKVQISMIFSGKREHFILPPTYSWGTDKVVKEIVSSFLDKEGFSFRNARIPEKLISVLSGLSKYGKNNITYIDGFGSYNRLLVFMTDMPGDTSDSFLNEPIMAELCSKCDACIKACPTKAISSELFVVNAGRCITNFNESEGDFPEWIKPEWHNCLVGCMICQDICPLNLKHKDWIVQGAEFSEEETKMIMDGIPMDELPEYLKTKLTEHAMFYEADTLSLQRNINVLRSQNSD